MFLGDILKESHLFYKRIVFKYMILLLKPMVSFKKTSQNMILLIKQIKNLIFMIFLIFLFFSFITDITLLLAWPGQAGLAWLGLGGLAWPGKWFYL